MLPENIKRPNFDTNITQPFKEGDKIFMIDDNDYDIWEVIIEKVEGEVYTIHYMDNPSEDEQTDTTDRMLPYSKANIKIFKGQSGERTEFPIGFKFYEEKKKKTKPKPNTSRSSHKKKKDDLDEEEIEEEEEEHKEEEEKKHHHHHHSKNKKRRKE